MRAREDRAVRVGLRLRSFETELVLPPGTDVLRAAEPPAIADVRDAVLQAVAAPIGAAPLEDMCRGLLEGTMPPRAGECQSAEAARGDRTPSVVVVVSDNTRPVPYRGEGGILRPLVERLIEWGVPADAITLLVATGTHRVMDDEEMWSVFDEGLRQTGVRAVCHDAADPASLARVGRTAAGADVFINRLYVEAGLRILTGLVEPHLMAGFSGGRKSICPGLVNVQTVRDFHGPRTLSHERATALCLEGNPCHAISLEIGGMAPADFIVNVTMRQDGAVAGVFAGDMQQAHLAAAERARGSAAIPLAHEYDVVVTHGGLVGVNHYQAEKAADIAGRAVRPGGYCVVVADTTDPDPVGTDSYRRLLALLAEMGPAGFSEAIHSDDWPFAHDQWGVQTWAKLFCRLPREHLYYYSPQTAADDYRILPGVDPRSLLGDPTGLPAGDMVSRFVSAATERARVDSKAETGRPATVAYLADGPHGIPVTEGSPR